MSVTFLGDESTSQSWPLWIGFSVSQDFCFFLSLVLHRKAMDEMFYAGKVQDKIYVETCLTLQDESRLLVLWNTNRVTHHHQFSFLSWTIVYLYRVFFGELLRSLLIGVVYTGCTVLKCWTTILETFRNTRLVKWKKTITGVKNVISKNPHILLIINNHGIMIISC